MAEGFKDTFTLQQVIRNLNDTLDGGTTGQAIVKASGTDFDYSWTDVASSPTVGDIDSESTAYGLFMMSDGDGTASWQYISSSIIVTGASTDGQVLTSAGAGGSAVWEDPVPDIDSDTVDITGNWTFSGTPTFSGVQINANTDWFMGSFNFVSGWINTKSYTQANFRDITHGVNTNIAKFTGTMLWDSTNGRPVWSSGTANGSVWVDHAGTTVHTPV